jgi:hypothetical protein
MPEGAHLSNEMKQRIVFIRLLVITALILFAAPLSECNAQRNASKKAEKELFGKTGKSKPFEAGKPKGAAGKAIKQQEKKEAIRKKEDEKYLKELRKQHYESQSEETRIRMENNSRNTEESYKAKKKNQRKEQTKPELKKPEQPKAKTQKAKVATKDPKKQPELKQQKGKAKSKMKDPKKQPKLKQHKINKYKR